MIREQGGLSNARPHGRGGLKECPRGLSEALMKQTGAAIQLLWSFWFAERPLLLSYVVPLFAAVGAASHEIRPEARMIVLASFNGGPTEQAVHLAILSSALTGVIVGGIIRRPGIGCLVG